MILKRGDETVNSRSSVACDHHERGYHKYFGDPRQDKCPSMRLIWRDKRRRIHRENGPAVIWSDGTRLWYRDGKRHREDGPAVVRPNRYKAWYRNGKCHREDGPAVIYSMAPKSGTEMVGGTVKMDRPSSTPMVLCFGFRMIRSTVKMDQLSFGQMGLKNGGAMVGGIVQTAQL